MTLSLCISLLKASRNKPNRHKLLWKMSWRYRKVWSLNWMVLKHRHKRLTTSSLRIRKYWITSKLSKNSSTRSTTPNATGSRTCAVPTMIQCSSPKTPSSPRKGNTSPSDTSHTTCWRSSTTHKKTISDKSKICMIKKMKSKASARPSIRRMPN